MCKHLRENSMCNNLKPQKRCIDVENSECAYEPLEPEEKSESGGKRK